MNINYIGSKKLLLEEIESVLKQNFKLKSNLVFGDLFAGTGVVGEHFNQKFGMHIISNDSEFYSFLLNYAKLKCPYSDKLHKIFKRWNKWSNKISKYGLFSKNYAYHNSLSENVPNRKFFSLENAQKIDGLRVLIEAYYQKQKITKSEYFFLLASLIASSDKVANITSVYGAYLKNFKLIAQKNFQFQPIHCYSQIPSYEKNQIFQKNSLEIDSLIYDICYLDPPYNHRQYSKNYAPLNFLAIYNNKLDVYGKTGLIRDSFMSTFCRKRTVLESFQLLLDRIKSQYILISYNSEGLLTLSQLRTLFEKYGAVKVYKFPYKRYKSQRESKTCKIEEYLFLIKCKKKITNESLGISLEQSLCLFNQINYPQSFNYRSSKFYDADLEMILYKFFEDHSKIQFQKYIGSRQNIADFQLIDGSTLSVKSNKSQSKVCPSKIGQLTKKRFCQEFHLPENTDHFQIKFYILKNVFKLTFKYYQNLFTCDYVLWIYKQKNPGALTFDYLLIHRKNAFPYPFTRKEEFTFTRDIQNWKESTTVKYKKVSIGEYQIHGNRDCIKFRFHFQNVLKFLKNVT